MTQKLSRIVDKLLPNHHLDIDPEFENGLEVESIPKEERIVLKNMLYPSPFLSKFFFESEKIRAMTITCIYRTGGDLIPGIGQGPP